MSDKNRADTGETGMGERECVFRAILLGERPSVREVEAALAARAPSLTLVKACKGRTLHFAPWARDADGLCGVEPYWRGGAQINYRPENPYCRKCAKAVTLSAPASPAPPEGREPQADGDRRRLVVSQVRIEPFRHVGHVACVECPACLFTFDARHVNEPECDTYSCDCGYVGPLPAPVAPEGP